MDVFEIMKELQNNIREIDIIENKELPVPSSQISQNLNLLNQSWHPLSKGPLPSEKRFLGLFISIIKRLIWKLTRAYNTMIFHHQIDFNANVVSLLNDLHSNLIALAKRHTEFIQRYNELVQRHNILSQRHNVLTQKYNDLDDRYNDVDQRYRELR